MLQARTQRKAMLLLPLQLRCSLPEMLTLQALTLRASSSLVAESPQVLLPA